MVNRSALTPTGAPCDAAAMRLVFISNNELDFTPLTPLQRPLGGMHSALCYLVLQLGRRGHDVTLVCRTTTPGTYDGVKCVTIETGSRREYMQAADVIISISSIGQALRRSGVERPILLWTGHDVDQAAVRNLSDGNERFAWDKFILVSHWQAERYSNEFGISKDKIIVLPNAIAPAFETGSRTRPLFFEDGRAPVLMYSSAPFRGLAILADAFPKIREQIPGTTAHIYSSMDIYQTKSSRELSLLYDRCRQTDGMKYFGSINQSELSQSILETDIFSYPSTFAETSCISLMEAMASECLVITREFGALSETASRFGHFLGATPVSATQLADDYAKFCVDIIRDAYDNRSRYCDELSAAKTFVRETYVWSAVAARWEAVLEAVSRTTPRSLPSRNALCPCGSGKRFKHCCGALA
jgi:glycosyltransferase involved in cell wall biosynthesis